jgi:hypothetical protein
MLLFEVCPQCPARELFDQIWREGEERERERERKRERNLSPNFIVSQENLVSCFFL